MSLRQKQALDPRLYFILGDNHCAEREPLDVLQAAVNGGTTLVQLREKTASTLEFWRIAQSVQEFLGPRQIPLLINDRIDIALAVGAAGIHIGQEDLPVTEARRLLGAEAIIGLTVQTMEQAAAAPLDLIDYISIGGVFSTSSKKNPNPPIGIDGFRDIAHYLRQHTAMPLTAIAGIDHSNAADVIGAGADGVAIISAICSAPDPQQAAHDLRDIIDTALTQRGSGS